MYGKLLYVWLKILPAQGWIVLKIFSQRLTDKPEGKVMKIPSSYLSAIKYIPVIFSGDRYVKYEYPLG